MGENSKYLFNKANFTHPGGWDYILFNFVFIIYAIYHPPHLKLSTDTLSLGDLRSVPTIDSVSLCTLGHKKGKMLLFVYFSVDCCVKSTQISDCSSLKSPCSLLSMDGAPGSM